MNSIATPKRIEAGAPSLALSGSRLATLLAAVILTLLLVSFKPLNPGDGPQDGGGDLVNQLGYGSLGLLAIACLLLFSDPRRLIALASPWWGLLLGFFALSILHATDPAAAARAASFSIIILLGLVATLSMPHSFDGLSAAVKCAALAVLGLSYAGLVLVPDAAIHGAGGYEAQHAGMWRGIYAHKNIAGPVMACLAYAGLWLWRRGERKAGAAIVLAAVVFVLNTGSKTTVGLIPAAMLLVIVPNLVGMRRMVIAGYLVSLCAFGLATLGIVYIDTLKHLAHAVVPDLTYTGRTTLWAFGGEMIAKKPWTGYGYASFWGTDFLAGQDLAFDADWDFRGIVHGHDGYMDIAIAMGLPALVAAIIVFNIAPLFDYMRVPRLKDSVLFADFLMMVLLFTTLNAFVETFFFHRQDPVWVLVIFATLGLRMTARAVLPSKG